MNLRNITNGTAWRNEATLVNSIGFINDTAWIGTAFIKASNFGAAIAGRNETVFISTANETNGIC